jgi:hypothetical protein
MTVCQVLSPIRSAKASSTRRVRGIAFFHIEIKGHNHDGQIQIQTSAPIKVYYFQA